MPFGRRVRLLLERAVEEDVADGGDGDLRAGLACVAELEGTGSAGTSAPTSTPAPSSSSSSPTVASELHPTAAIVNEASEASAASRRRRTAREEGEPDMLRIHLHTMCRQYRNVHPQRNAAIPYTYRFAWQAAEARNGATGRAIGGISRLYFLAGSAGFTISTSQETSVSAPPHGGYVRFEKAFSTQLPTGLPW